MRTGNTSITTLELRDIIKKEILSRKNHEDKGQHKRPLLVAIDGRSASGKTTLAGELAEEFDASVIHMDDFFLPVELRTPERFAMPGGNVHFERFQEEIMTPFEEGRLESYRRFDCKVLDFEEKKKQVKQGDVLFVEGAYSTLPRFGRYYDFSVFMDITYEEQIKRIEKRNGPEKCKQFVDRWIPLEEAYINAYQVKEQADYYIR